MGLFATSENSGALSSIVVVEGDSIAKANPQIYLEYLRKHVHFEKNIHQTTINSERHQSFLKSKVLSGFTANNSKSKLITRQLASLSYTGNINTFLSLRGGGHSYSITDWYDLCSLFHFLYCLKSFKYFSVSKSPSFIDFVASHMIYTSYNSIIL